MATIDKDLKRREKLKERGEDLESEDLGRKKCLGAAKKYGSSESVRREEAAKTAHDKHKDVVQEAVDKITKRIEGDASGKAEQDE